MSEIEDTIGKALVQLINELARIGLISKIRLIEQIGPENIIIIKESNRYDYEQIAEYLKEHPVFIPIDRKRAVYAQKRLEKILGCDVRKKPTKLGYTKGYLFFT